MTGRLYYGDNLSVMRENVRDKSIDLIYLDPPFNSNANYNVLFHSPSGKRAHAQIQAFEDTWHWGAESAIAYDEVMRSGANAAGILRALRGFLGENDLMAYLAMMTVRLIEMRRILRDTGSIYLHCDPTASHYLKLIMDGIFGAEFFRNEIVWQRTTSKGHATTRYPSSHDTILFYGRSAASVWERPFLPLRDAYIDSHYGHVEEGSGRRYALDNCLNPNPDRPNLTYEWNGHLRVWRWTRERMAELDAAGRLAYTASGMPRYKRYLDETKGTPVTDVWTDIRPVNSQARERLGYPTQKPLSLLQRIIAASTRPGDTVLDPFCGCGTAVHAAHSMERDWIGIDVTHIAIQVIEDRLRHHYPALSLAPVTGRPTTLDGARDLAARDKYQFQWWATWLVGGTPRGGHKKGSDRGVDGDLYFKTGRAEHAHAIISVKGGRNLGPQMIRDLKGAQAREGADLAIFVCLEEPSAEMRREAAASDFYETPHLLLPTIQIVTIAELLRGSMPRPAPIFTSVSATQEARDSRRRKAPRMPSPDQRELLLTVPGGKAAASLPKVAELPVADGVPSYLRAHLRRAG